MWAAFVRKAGADVGTSVDGEGINEEQLDKLAERDINGRQIKNATRTAASLAVGRGEKLRYSHLVETLDAMDDFTSAFKALGAV